MRFSISQTIGVAPGVAMAAYGNPAFYEGRPPSGDISLVEVVSHAVNGSRVVIEVRYRFTGSVSSAVRAIIDPAKLSWVTRTELDEAARRSHFTVVPDHYPDRLECRGSSVFSEGATGPESTVITFEGDLKVHVFLVGRTVEQMIVTGLRTYLVTEMAGLPDFKPSD
jgi:hypothetical protein